MNLTLGIALYTKKQPLEHPKGVIPKGIALRNLSVRLFKNYTKRFFTAGQALPFRMTEGSAVLRLSFRGVPRNLSVRLVQTSNMRFFVVVTPQNDRARGTTANFKISMQTSVCHRNYSSFIIHFPANGIKASQRLPCLKGGGPLAVEGLGVSTKLYKREPSLRACALRSE